MTEGSHSPPIRIRSLDALRGAAILLVLGRHIADVPHDLPTALKVIVVTWRSCGWIGVDLFFVLSGFLVSNLIFSEYQRTGTVRIGRFLIRRGFKIYPPYYLFLFATMISMLWIGSPQPFDASDLIHEALFIQNYLGGIWNHTWSLSVEEHFYLLLAALSLFFTRVARDTNDPFRFFTRLVPTFMIVLLLLRIVAAYSVPTDAWDAVLGYTHLRIDSLFLGVLISYLYSFRPELFQRKSKTPRSISFTFIIAATALLPIALPLGSHRFMHTGGFLILALGFGCLLIRAISAEEEGRGGALRLPPLETIGRYSYSIYLWHMALCTATLIIWPATDSTLATFVIRTSVYLLGSLFVGIGVFYLVERPMLRLRDRYFPSSS